MTERSFELLPVALLTLAAAAVGVVATDLGGVLRPTVILVFLAVAPGAGLVGLLRVNELAMAIALSIALSVVLGVAIAQAMVWTATWSPTGAVMVLAGATVVLAIAQLVRVAMAASAAEKGGEPGWGMR
jgi:hypothetical protein